jgi:hypothetical protein
MYMPSIFILSLISIDRDDDDLTTVKTRITRNFCVESSAIKAGWFYKTVVLNNTLIPWSVFLSLLCATLYVCPFRHDDCTCFTPSIPRRKVSATTDKSAICWNSVV